MVTCRWCSLLAITFAFSVSATELIPQVETKSALTGQAPPDQTLPVNNPVVGKPILYTNGTVTEKGSSSNDESQALLSAFGAFLNALGGGGIGSVGGQGSIFPGRSEIVDPGDSGDSGGNYAQPSGLVPVSPSELTGLRKIIPPFQKWFGICTKNLGFGNCRFENMGIMGDASHRARRSCHNSGEAIDVGTVTCSGGQRIAPKSAAYLNLANCMANDSSNELQVIYYKASGPNMIQKSDHDNHMHVQLKNCSMVYGN
jgi:hypothetical protein